MIKLSTSLLTGTIIFRAMSICIHNLQCGRLNLQLLRPSSVPSAKNKNLPTFQNFREKKNFSAIFRNSLDHLTFVCKTVVFAIESKRLDDQD
jgi:hypothetical protein